MKKKFSIVIISVLLFGYLVFFDILLVGVDEIIVIEDMIVKMVEIEIVIEVIESEFGLDNEKVEELKEVEVSKEMIEKEEKVKIKELVFNIKIEINIDKS